jgi:hypothetical protein
MARLFDGVDRERETAYIDRIPPAKSLPGHVDLRDQRSNPVERLRLGGG